MPPVQPPNSKMAIWVFSPAGGSQNSPEKPSEATLSELAVTGSARPRWTVTDEWACPLDALNTKLRSLEAFVVFLGAHHENVLPAPAVVVTKSTGPMGSRPK